MNQPFGMPDSQRHPSCQTLVELLRRRAQDEPDRLAFSYLKTNGGSEHQLAYAALDRQARILAAWLQKQGHPGDRALLLFGGGLDVVIAFWACLYAGIVAVPAPPPDAAKAKHSLPRLKSIVRDAQVTLVLASHDVQVAMEPYRADLGFGAEVQWCDPAAIESDGCESAKEYVPAPDTLAYLQYTSGSTSDPKGVMVTHASLLHHSAILAEAVHGNHESRSLTWLPYFHDYGLIHGLIVPVFLGTPSYLMSPLAFLRTPMSWLAAIGAHRITHSGGPNFAFEHCLRVISPEQRATLDLSSWTVASCGAEPIRASTIADFVATFKDCGFHAEAFSPAYGMAEYTLLVSVKGSRAPQRILEIDGRVLALGEIVPAEGENAMVRRVVGCGTPIGDTVVAIVDPQTMTRCAPHRVGEIWLAGRSAAQGYWNRPAETAETFGAHLADTGEGPFLRTGDLGFVRDGEIYITGRLKDLIIVRGRNYYPQDIELTAAHAHPALRSRGGAAFSFENEAGEKAVLVHEVERGTPQDQVESISSSVRQLVAEQHELHLSDIVLIKAGSLPRTSSGKVQRGLCRDLFFKQALLVVAQSMLSDTPEEERSDTVVQEAAGQRLDTTDVQALEECIRQVLAQQLNMSPSKITPETPLGSLGLDSLMTSLIKNRLERLCGVSPSFGQLLSQTTVRELAHDMRESAAAGGADRRDQSANHENSADRLRTANPSDKYAMSFGQQRIAFLEQMHPGSALNNISFGVRLRGPFDPLRLEASVQTIMARHEMFRANFVLAEQAFIIREHKPQSPMLVHDLKHVVNAAQEEAVQRLVEEDVSRPFDLANGPLFRVTLVILAPGNQVLLITVHRLIADGWSLRLFCNELSLLYGSHDEKTDAVPRPPAAQYTEYVDWQRSWLSSTFRLTQEQYWREQLRALPPPVELPTDCPRVDRMERNAQIQTRALSPTLVSNLSPFCRAQGVTKFMACYAAFVTWLSHSTGASDLVVGSVVANRRRTVFEEVIGYFVNTIALRLQQDEGLSVHDYLRTVRRVITEAYDNQDVPFEVVLENLKMQREGTGPIFNIMIVLEDDPVSDLHLRDVEATVIPLRMTALECDLVLMVVNRASGIELVAAYDADLFQAETMTRMLHQLEVLLTQMVAQPEARIVSLPMMTPEERQTILVDWNRTGFPVPDDSCVHHEIIRQAERTPDAVAVVCGNESVSYSELHERSNRVACVLRAWGVSSDTRVGLCLERSVDSIVAILGVLKAGGAYVPIDPGYPEQRINLILTDADVSVVVTHRGIQHRVRVSGRKVLNLDAPAVFHAIGDAPDVSKPDHLAYIIYTSGSTGKPKGVEITHRSLMASLTARLHYYPAGVDRFLLTFPTAFDGSVTGIFWCLLQGGTLVIPTETMHRDPLHLGALIEAHRITHVVWVPSLYEAVLRDVAPESLTSLRIVISAGESLPPRLVHQHYRVLPQASLFNEYGPTESTVWCTVYRTTRDRPDVRVPIGRPTANTQVYVLDSRLEPVSIGMPGELYVAGSGLARGYLNDAALTRQRFITHPFEAGSRVYRTGDIVRYRADGNLEYLERADHQVKLRGHRIELSEIENVLCTYPGIHQAVVLLQEDKTGQRLASYVVGAPEIQLEFERVKSYLAMRLPPYMLPAVIIRLDAFPQTVAGKIDRRALPLPEEPGSHKPWNTAPSTPTEQALVGIWKDVLSVTEFGVDDNFFHLGGHSLLATQVASRIRETLHVECPLRMLFEHTTIAGLAQALAELQEPPRISPSREIQPLPRDRAFPLSFSQQRMWFMYQLAPLATAYNIPNAIRLRGPLNRPAMDRAVRELVKRHEALRTTFAQAADGPVQIIGAPDLPSFAEADLRVLPSEERLREAIRLVEEDAAWPFDLTQGPVARLLLITLEADDHVVLLNMHHIIGDQWSFGVIGRDFAVLYNALCKGEAIPTVPLKLQYADYAVWQRHWLTDEALQVHLKYWREKLSGLEVLALPTDYPRLKAQRFLGAYRSVELPDALLHRLGQLVSPQGNTVFMGLLAVFKILLSRYAGQADIAVGVPIANRTLLSTEDIVGSFVNTLVMRTDLGGTPTFREVLSRVRETAVAAYEHQDLPFERLVEELSPARDASRAPLVQVLFNVANAPIGAIELHKLTWESFEFDAGAAQFDLSLTVDIEVTKKAFLAYRTDLFDGVTIERMIEQYRRLLEEALEDPDKSMTDYHILSHEDRHLILNEWNDTSAPYPDVKVLPELIAAQVRLTPAAIAVAMDGKTLTYAALEAQSNQLANYLGRKGVTRGDLVGICLDRSPAMVIGLLAIMKAGAAYVPLDPGYPKHRLNYMVQDSGIHTIVTVSSLADLLPREGRDLLCLDREGDRMSREPATTASGPAPADVAYVIYTSGSTGQPKGVVICHRSLVNFLWSMKRYPGCTARDLLLSVTTLSFDIAGLEIFLPLLVGGRVELVSRQVASDGRLLKRRIQECRPSIMQATPATWRMLIDAGWGGTTGLTALCGGEALSRDLADQLLARTGALWNMYGPTETTIWSTVSRIEAEDSEITIGRPIANTQLYILDGSLHPAPIGVPGELYLGGDGVALGYYKRSDLTVERFIPDPFSDRPGARLYKTGDRARYRSDGHVVHLGRLDHQVKIRGFRIELGEIEAALRTHASIRQVVVVAQPDQSGGHKLVAYLIHGDGQRPFAKELRAFLAEKLPDYMVPSHFITMSSFPLTANGKVDIRALPLPSEERALKEEAAVEPRTALEFQLAALWQQVLGVSAVSVHDNFFHLGGHSLTAVQLFAHLEQVFGKGLPLATLFQAPTIAQLAATLTASDWAAPWGSLVAIQPQGTRPPLFAVPGVGGNVLMFAKLAQLLGQDQPFYGLQAIGLDGTTPPLISVVDIASRYIEEIRTVRPAGPYVIVGTCTGGVVAFEIAQQLRRKGHEVALMIIESWHPSSYTSHRSYVPMALWPMLYVCSKAASYAQHLRHIPLRQWKPFIYEKAQALYGLITRKDGVSGNGDGSLVQERVRRATYMAVAGYKPARYPGGLCNLIASKRLLAAGISDTRMAWTELAEGLTQHAAISAEDSGRMFLSPHVEQLAQHLLMYTSVALSGLSHPDMMTPLQLRPDRRA